MFVVKDIACTAEKKMNHVFQSSGLRLSFVNLVKTNCKVIENKNTLELCKNNQFPCNFDELLLLAWKKAEESGCCRYDLKLKVKRVPGKCGFVVQLNEQRAVNRRPPQAFSNVTMSFDAQKFNFTKIKSNELLFKIDRQSYKDGISSTSNGHPVDMAVINVSPFAVGHMLIVPQLSACRPQILTFDTVQLALQVQLLSLSPKYITVYNSMCAQASVNHLHVHSYYLAVGDDSASNLKTSPNLLIQQNLPVSKQLSKNCYICDCLPVPSFLFPVISQEDIDAVAGEVSLIVDYLLEHNIAHNLAIARAPSVELDYENNSNDEECFRLYLWPRLNSVGAKNDFNINIGACELTGHIFVADESVYDSITEEEILRQVSSAALPADTFNSIVNYAMTALNEPAVQCIR